MIKKTKKIGRFLINIQFIRFLIIGFINTIFGYSIFCLFIFLNFHYTLALLLANILGILFNFKTFGLIVFKSHNNILIFKFTGVYLAVYFVNIACLKILQIFSVNNYIGQALLIIPLAILVFVLNKKFVFLKRR